jgi:hypothetical protein
MQVHADAGASVVRHAARTGRQHCTAGSKGRGHVLHQQLVRVGPESLLLHCHVTSHSLRTCRVHVRCEMPTRCDSYTQIITAVELRIRF